jgi:hypothetical protein
MGSVCTAPKRARMPTSEGNSALPSAASLRCTARRSSSSEMAPFASWSTSSRNSRTLPRRPRQGPGTALAHRAQRTVGVGGCARRRGHLSRRGSVAESAEPRAEFLDVDLAAAVVVEPSEERVDRVEPGRHVQRGRRRRRPGPGLGLPCRLKLRRKRPRDHELDRERHLRVPLPANTRARTS